MEKRGEDGREEGEGEGSAMQGNRDTVLAVSHVITRTINFLRTILYENISWEI